MAAVKALLAAVIVGGMFGSASAQVESITDGTMTLVLEVEVQGSPGTVVAHLAFEDEPVLTLPLLERGDSVYGIRTELEAKNYVVVFESVGEESSDPITLAQLGADLGSGGPTGTQPPSSEEDLSPESRQMMWLAIALGAASLSLLAFWALGGRETSDESPGPGDEEE